MGLVLQNERYESNLQLLFFLKIINYQHKLYRKTVHLPTCSNLIICIPGKVTLKHFASRHHHRVLITFQAF